jgi:hypothetical protein
VTGVPSSKQSATGISRERFPEVAAEIGEDPARWLDKPVTNDNDAGGMARIRIQSIDKLSVAEGWIEVEHELSRGPRQEVIKWLRERILELEKIGERPDRLEPVNRTKPETEAYLVRDGDRVPWSEVDRSVGITSDERPFAVATDGGESPDE